MADPGFPRGGGANLKGGAPTYYLANFSRKLHENEEILGQRGGARPSRPSLDPPLANICDGMYGRMMNYGFAVSKEHFAEQIRLSAAQANVDAIVMLQFF